MLEDLKVFLQIGVPRSIIYALLSVALVGYLILFIKKKPSHWYYALLLTVYGVFLFLMTVLFRPNEVEDTDPYLFWSYVEGFNGKTYLFVQIVLNIILFMPIGILIAGCVKSRGALKTFLVGFSLSVTIEVLQLLFSKGLAEFDDVFHNTLGCLLGFYLVRGCQSIIKRAKSHHTSLETIR